MNRNPLNLLLSEDSDSDAALISTTLESQGYDLNTVRVRTEHEFQASEFRYFTQRNALIALTREIQTEILQTEEVFRRITEKTAKTLHVDRVSIWCFTPNHESIECLDLYELTTDRHSAGLTLNASEHPVYCEAIKTMELIAADDAVNDPITRDFAKNYLLPLGIGALLDVPVLFENQVSHLLCCEHVGPARIWTADEKTFAVAIANLISLSSEIRGRTLARQEVLASQHHLEAVIVKVAQSVSGSTGSEFFEALAKNMVEALGASGGVIGKFDPVSHSIETISFVENGEIMPNMSYDLHGTPCENVASGEICVMARDVPRLFPENHLLSRLGVEAYVGIPLPDQNGTVVGVMAVFFTSPLHETALATSTLRIFAARAASELTQQQAFSRIREQASLLDKARDAILVRDLDHTITYWNKSAERLYGWTAEEAIGRSVADLLHQEISGFHIAHEQTLQAGEWAGELIQIDKSGRELTIEGRWSLVADDSGRPQSILAINTDISEYRKLEQQFIRAQRLESIGTLAGGIAHDLNNILTPISMAVELLRMREPEERSLELLDMIALSTNRGANMISRVLAFARGDKGCHVRTQPGLIISEIEGILRDTFPRNIEVEVSVDPDLWVIDADFTQIHQVLLNLCVNARDAISESGRIRIRAENVHLDAAFAADNLEAVEGPYVCVRVMDSGDGIPPDVIDRIFDPFFTTKEIGKGTGLGLPTSLAIVKSHGGFLQITSKPGEGTLACVYLPAHVEWDNASLAPRPSDLPKGGGEVILVVADEPSAGTFSNCDKP